MEYSIDSQRVVGSPTAQLAHPGAITGCILLAQTRQDGHLRADSRGVQGCHKLATAEMKQSRNLIQVCFLL
jgi:hypothetical protein